MSALRTFVVQVNVSREYMESDQSMAVALAHTILKDKASDPLTGPRGGRYLPVGDVYDIRGGQDAEDFMMNRWTFVGRVKARYQRPPKAAKG